MRLRFAFEKLKMILNANPEAPLHIKCLIDEEDVRELIKREKLEPLSIPIMERV